MTARTFGLTCAALVPLAANSWLCRAALRAGAIDPASFTAVPRSLASAMFDVPGQQHSAPPADQPIAKTSAEVPGPQPRTGGKRL